MAGTFYYIAFDDGWTVNLGTTAVRLGSGFSFTELAEMGAVGAGSIVIDDLNGTAGQSSDGFLALQQFAYDESLASPARVYMGWTGDRDDHRGDDSLRLQSMRKIALTLKDGNTLAGRRAIWPATSDATVKRPSETAAARIAWLLGTDYFSGVADNGLVLPATVTLDADDLSNMSPADVLNNICVQSGDNWFVYWDRGAAAWSLAVFDFTTYDGFTATLQLSNDPTLVDSNIRDGAGPTNTWAVTHDAVRTRSGEEIATELIRPYAKGTVIVTGTSSVYPVVSHIAPSTSDKTSSAATAAATRMLGELDDETHRIRCSAQIRRENVNDALAGQLVRASFIHMPPYTSMSDFRIAHRSVSQAERSDQFYTVGYELIPAEPATAVYSFAILDYDQAPVTGGGPWLVQWLGTGDAPPAGWSIKPLVGNMAYDATGGTAGRKTGIKTTGAGTVTVKVVASSQFCYGVFDAGGHDVTLTLLQNGGSIGTSTWIDTHGPGAHCTDTHVLTVTRTVTAALNDIFTAEFSVAGGAGTSNAIPAGVPAFDAQYLSVTGYLV